MANKKPVFCSYNTEIVSLRAIGSDQQHLKLTLKHNNHTHEVIGFRIDVAYEVDINNWNGNKTIQLRLIDIRETS